ncbi:MAG TPA: protoporphyrinogen oxidase [Streptosporangiaceae bacterium]
MSSPNSERRRSVVIIGGGISGLAAAFLLRDAGLAVTVLEGSPRIGGKLSVSEVGGIAVDAGAEALLARRPEGTGLISDLALDDDRRVPGTTSAGIWTRGSIRPLPRRQFMGVPADLDELAATGILSEPGLARARQDLSLPTAQRGGDESVASRVGGRFGAELVDRMVEPLLGGVYAGRTEDLSFDATLTPLAKAAHGHDSLAEAAATLLPPRPEPSDGVTPQAPPPVFTTLAAGLGTLPAALAAASGAVVRTTAMVRELARTPSGWRLTVGSAHAPETVEADAVILAVPAVPASRLLAREAVAAAAALAEIKYASMAIVTLAYAAPAFGAPPTRSGFLVPAVDGRAVKAVTFSTVKWPHLRRAASDPHVVRCSVGRFGEDGLLQRDDRELAALAVADLAAATGVAGQPVDIRVTRWGGGLPQYTVGHLERVARIRASLAGQPGLAICGAAYDGVGVPACIATAKLAVAQVLSYLGSQDAAGADVSGASG